jgi:hypothetical protein
MTNVNIIDWINVGKLSAERDDLLNNYFFDNNTLSNSIASPSSFLVLGRKGAGKTAIFRYLSENNRKFIGGSDILIPLSFENYNWNIHSLLIQGDKAESLAYKQSWYFVILVEAVKAYYKHFINADLSIPVKVKSANKLLEKLFDSPIPSIGSIVGRKLLALSRISLPNAGLDVEGGGLDSLEISGGEVSFDSVKADKGLQESLSRNIEYVITILEACVSSASSEWPKVFVCFDRVDEAWDEVSYISSKPVIAGLVSACDSITSKYKGSLRPIVFLREDIFDSLAINDANKLREDCGALLHWNRVTLHKLVLCRINYFSDLHNVEVTKEIDALFDKPEMRQRTKPFNYIIKRTMMRPRDLISFLGKVISAMKERAQDPLSESEVSFKLLETEYIYAAEPGYSEWLKQEILDEWLVQKPEMKSYFSALQNNASTNFTKQDLESAFSAVGLKVGSGAFLDHLRFLFDNSIIGFKIGESNEWRFKCFYPTQGFLDSPEYRIHEGLVRALNLKENRDKEES